MKKLYNTTDIFHLYYVDIDNPKAKQLPDKCIDALSRWVDNINKEETKKEK